MKTKIMNIPVAKPYFTRDDEQAVADVVASRWVLQGPKVQEFEKLLSEYIDIPYAVATSSATTALLMALLILKIGPGDEVLVPSFSYIASTNCVVHAGATPVFVDIDARTYNIDPHDIENKITKKTRAILVVHQIGLMADIKPIKAIAKKYNLRIVEDAACALGATAYGQNAGTVGDIGGFSFHPRKCITTAEGGLLTTKKKAWFETAKMLRAHGASVSVIDRHASNTIVFEKYPIVGYNFRMSDIHAALGVSQFKKIDRIFSRRQEIAARYTSAFKNYPQIIPPYIPPHFHHTFQSYLIRLPGGAKIRDKVMQSLLEKGISTRRGIPGAHLEPPYRHLKAKLPVTELASRETIMLPIFTELTHAEQDYVIENVIQEIANG